MRYLSALQHALQSSILTGSELALVHVAGTRDVSATTRLNIYREGYYLRLTEALATTYECLHALLGEDQFSELARRYIDSHPSRHYSVRYFGHRLATFLGKMEPYRSTPLLADLARWEWAVADVFDAHDAIPIAASTLQVIPAERWPHLRFRFHSAIRLASSRWNVADVWSAHIHERSMPALQPLPNRARWAIWRQNLKVYFASVEYAQEQALRAAMRDDTFAQICTRAPASGGEHDAALWAAGLLRQWIERGWIVECLDLPAKDATANEC